MLALSIIQPWAWLIVTGNKDVENRTWPTKVRGIISIHAGKKFDKEGYEFVKNNFSQIHIPDRNEFNFGGIVGVAKITGCVSEMDSPWFFGPYGFTLSDQKVVDFIPCKGQLGFFKPQFDFGGCHAGKIISPLRAE